MTMEFNHREIRQTPNIDEIMKIVFKTQKQADIGTKIIESIREKREMYDYEMKELARSVNCSEKWFYSKVLRSLQKTGMVRKNLNQYSLSTDFANSLKRLERSWRRIV